MTKVYRILAQVSWVLGLLSILAGFLIKLLNLEQRLTVTGRTAFILAGTFFLCALATRGAQRP